MKSISVILALLGVSQACLNYLGGEVKTYQTFKYGRFVSRMLPAMKKGTDTSFFTYWAGPHWSANQWNEIDIEVVPSLTMEGFNRNVIYGDGHVKRQDGGPRAPVTVGDMSQYHDLSIEWTPEYIEWKVDGVVKERYDHSTHHSVDYIHKPQKLMMNFWPPNFSPWKDGLTWHDMPYTSKYDYVEVYSYDEHSKTFNFEWKDDFDTFDSSRWEISNNWSFGGNLCLFVKDHVKVEDSNLVLTLGTNPKCHPRDTEERLQEF